MAPVIGLVLDCGDPEALAPFWAEALGYTSVGSAGSYVMLLPASGAGPQLLLQRVPEPRSSKNRMHLDIHVPEPVAGCAKSPLGAEQPDRWTVYLATPDVDDTIERVVNAAFDAGINLIDTAEDKFGVARSRLRQRRELLAVHV